MNSKRRLAILRSNSQIVKFHFHQTGVDSASFPIQSSFGREERVAFTIASFTETRTMVPGRQSAWLHK